MSKSVSEYHDIADDNEKSQYIVVATDEPVIALVKSTLSYAASPEVEMVPENEI